MVGRNSSVLARAELALHRRFARAERTRKNALYLGIARVGKMLRDDMLPGSDTEALFATACRLDRAGETDRARQAYLDVLARDMSHAGALAGLGDLLFATGYTSAARTTYAQAVAAHPDDPAARVRLGHLLRAVEEPDLARAEYVAALARDPACPEAHQGLAYLLGGIDETAALRHRDLGFSSRSLTTTPYRGRGRPVRVLRLVSARGGNIPMRHILDDLVFATDSLVCEYARTGEALAGHDVVFNAIGDADRCGEALAAAARIVAGTSARVLNPPERVQLTTRAAALRRLSALPGVVAPHAAMLSRATLAQGVPAGFALPLLLRSPGFHTGQHFCRIDSLNDWAEQIAALPGDPLLAIQYFGAAVADGWFRKYRVMLIGGEILPLHLAISADWKVHYYTAGMEAHPQHRAEEARFLADMAGVLGKVAMAALAAIAATLGLDYAGVDFALAADGRLLLFEANAAMTIVPPAEGAMWDYRRPAVQRALNASRSLIAGKRAILAAD
jgi:tetratricopeptide (TPR) repeat protein